MSNRQWRKNVTVAALDKSFDELYRYDRLNRLKLFQRGILTGNKTALTSIPAQQQTWKLDPAGNWGQFTESANGIPQLQQTRKSNPANEITAITAWALPAYDEAGNMTNVPLPADPTQAYRATYDAWNRLVKLLASDECGCPHDTVATYQYDPMFRRVIKVTYEDGDPDETRHSYFSCNWQVLEERIGAATTPDRQHIWGRRYIDDLILRDRDTGGDTDLNERLYVLQDANWNVTSIANTSGAIQERYSYAAYGTPTFLEPDFDVLTDSAFAWERLFTGQPMDSGTGLYLMRMRYFSSPLGLWLSRDPAPRDYSSLYAYSALNPIRHTDPTGLNVYVIGGTGETAEHRDYPRRFWEFTDETRYYWDGTGSRLSVLDAVGLFGVPAPFVLNTVAGVSNTNIVNNVYHKVCEDYCANKNITINLVGWSRGAMAALLVASYLDSSGCCCVSESKNRSQIGPISRHSKHHPKVNWIGMFDAVSMHWRPGWDTGVPKNVRRVSHAMKTMSSLYEDWIMQQEHSLPILGKNTIYTPNPIWNFDGTPTGHGDVGGFGFGLPGGKDKNGALRWMLMQAAEAKVQLTDAAKKYIEGGDPAPYHTRQLTPSDLKALSESLPGFSMGY